MKNNRCLGVMIAKANSNRLPGKNRRDFHGKEMFLHNLEKMLSVFQNVIFDSDCSEMIGLAEQLGASARIRPRHLCGDDVPSVPIFQSILESNSAFDYMLNLQANSPNVTVPTIERCLDSISMDGVQEVLTCYRDYKINGSVWAFSKRRLETYGDPYTHLPDILVVDESIDVHTIKELEAARGA
jgi:CMP-N-acetylneuraminic acid synthetase